MYIIGIKTTEVACNAGLPFVQVRATSRPVLVGPYGVLLAAFAQVTVGFVQLRRRDEAQSSWIRTTEMTWMVCRGGRRWAGHGVSLQSATVIMRWPGSARCWPRSLRAPAARFWLAWRRSRQPGTRASGAGE